MERMASIRQALRGLKDRDSGIISITPARILIMSPKTGRNRSTGRGKKEKPILKRVKDGKKIAMKKKINIGVPISIQIYIFYFNVKGIFVRRTYPSPFRK